MNEYANLSNFIGFYTNEVPFISNILFQQRALFTPLQCTFSLNILLHSLCL